MKKELEKRGANNRPMDALVNKHYNGYSPVILFHITGGAALLISDPAVVEAMYTSKNKYFNKHPIVKNLTQCLMGNSILFAETSEAWK